MPFYYDIDVAGTPNAGAPGITIGTSELTFLWGKTAAAPAQEIVGIAALYMASRIGTAGGAQARIKDNIGVSAANGTAQTPRPRNLRMGSLLPAISAWSYNATGLVSAGSTLTARVTIGFAQTGGMGGWVATEPTNKIQMMPNTLMPVDIEVSAIATSASTLADMTLEIGEGI